MQTLYHPILCFPKLGIWKSKLLKQATTTNGTNDHKPPENDHKPPNYQQTTTNHWQMTTNHQQTTTNHQTQITKQTFS